VGVPSGSSRSGFAFTVTDHGNSNVVWLVHDRTIGDGQTITELTTLVDGSGSFGVDLTVSGYVATRSELLTCEGNPPGEEKALTKASIPSADIGYSL